MLRAHLPKEHKEDSVMAQSKYKFGATQIIGIICVLLMIALFVSQFIPYWTITVKDEPTDLSVAQYTWFPTEKAYKSVFLKDIKAQLVDAGLMLEEQAKAVKINHFVYPAAVLTIFAFFGFVLCPFKVGEPLGIFFTLATGISGIWMSFSHPIYRLGPTWTLTMVLSIVLTVFSVLNIAAFVLYLVKKNRR
jgi:hypothetical protein